MEIYLKNILRTYFNFYFQRANQQNEQMNE